MSDARPGRLLPRRPMHAAIDCAAILLVMLAATLSFGPVFGGTAYLLAGLGAAVLGIGVLLCSCGVKQAYEHGKPWACVEKW